jgi:hypothetical protein
MKKEKKILDSQRPVPLSVSYSSSRGLCGTSSGLGSGGSGRVAVVHVDDTASGFTIPACGQI